MIKSVYTLQGKTALIVGDGAVPSAIANLFREAGASTTHVREPNVSEAGVEALFDGVKELDILVNGAARIGAWPLDQLTMEEWDRVHDMNVKGAFLLMRGAVRKFLERDEGGRLINISTIGSVHPVLHGNYAYGSSRAGTNALSRQFAFDYADKNILSNAILVGTVPSYTFPEGMPPPRGPGMDRNRLPGKSGDPDAVAPVALLLASHAGRFITGQAIVVDGGFLIG